MNTGKTVLEGETARPVQPDRVINPKGLRKTNIPYLIIWVVYYAWIIVFTTWWTSSPVANDAFTSGMRSILHSVNLISSAAFIFLIKSRYIRFARVGAAVLIASMVTFLLFYSSPFAIFAAVLIGISIGCVNICILMPFVFLLNNTEKFYATVGSFFLIGILSLFTESGAENAFPPIFELLISFVILILALSMIPFFKKSDVSAVPIDGGSLKKIPKRVYLTLLFNCIFAVLCKGIGTGILDLMAKQFRSVMMLFVVGEITGCVIYYVIYRFVKNSIHLAWNIVFSCLAMGLLCNALSPGNVGLSAAFGILIGIGNTVGMINVYYILGVIGKKYNSMRYLQYSILFIGICGGIAGVITGNLVSDAHAFSVSITASIICAAVILVFLMLSPVLTQIYYGDEWVGDSEKPEIDNEQLHLFQKYNMSKRELEVCRLLLQGYTLRQISAILSIAYPTVNTYCTSLYRKLSINSRTELLLLFKDYIIHPE